MADEATQAAIRSARGSYGRLISMLAARGTGLAEAEDALAEAFAAALAQWPRDGVPRNPDGWLHAVARRRQVDLARRRATAQREAGQMCLMIEELSEDLTDDGFPDRRLGLLFACAHPDIEPGFRSALMLNTVIGLTAAQIAPLYLVSAGTMSQRLTRGKARIAASGVPFAVPDAHDVTARLPAVLDAIYAALTRGYIEEGGDSPLAEEARFLAAVTADLTDTAEAWGLLALICHIQARAGARRSDARDYVPFHDQNVRGWDLSLIRQAERVLARASTAGLTGRFQIEAAIQSAQVVARLTGTDTSAEVLRLYDHLLRLAPSPVIRLNRAVALAAVAGPAAGLAEIEELGGLPAMRDHQPYWSARLALARAASDKAKVAETLPIVLGLTTDLAVRRWLERS